MTAAILLAPRGDTLAYASLRQGNADIYLMDVWHRLELRLIASTAHDESPAWSPDGSIIAFVSDRDGDSDLYLADRFGRDIRRLTNAPGADFSPAWSPDSESIAFVSGRDGDMEIVVLTLATGEVRQLTHNLTNDYAPAWRESPEGLSVVYTSALDGNTDIFVFDLTAGTRGDFGNAVNLPFTPSWSVQGHLTYTANRGDRARVFVQEGAGMPERALTPREMNVNNPVWSPDGRWIAFESSHVDSRELYLIHPGSGHLRRLTRNPFPDYGAQWRPKSSRR
ncbi:MAG: hypothetical protein SF029_12430 [bacterium]|nr:hypothetical protein [bacterium]